MIIKLRHQGPIIKCITILFVIQYKKNSKTCSNNKVCIVHDIPYYHIKLTYFTMPGVDASSFEWLVPS